MRHMEIVGIYTLVSETLSLTSASISHSAFCKFIVFFILEKHLRPYFFGMMVRGERF